MSSILVLQIEEQLWIKSSPPVKCCYGGNVYFFPVINFPWSFDLVLYFPSLSSSVKLLHMYILGCEFKGIKLSGQVAVSSIEELVFHVKRYKCSQVFMRAIKGYPLISSRVNTFSCYWNICWLQKIIMPTRLHSATIFFFHNILCFYPTDRNAAIASW